MKEGSLKLTNIKFENVQFMANFPSDLKHSYKGPFLCIYGTKRNFQVVPLQISVHRWLRSFFFLGVCLQQLEFIFSLDWVCLCEFVRMFKPAKSQLKSVGKKKENARYHTTESYNRLGLKAFSEDSKLL